MAKNKGRPRQQPQRTQRSTVAARQPAVKDPLTDAKEDAAEQGVAVDDLLPRPSDPSPAEVSPSDSADAARAIYERLRDRLAANLEELEGLESDLSGKAAEVHQQRQRLDEQTAECEARLRQLADRAAELEARELEMLAREADADMDFLGRRDEVMAPLRTQLRELTASWAEHDKDLVAGWQASLREHRERMETELVAERESLSTREAALAERERRADEREQSLVGAAREHDARQALLQEEIELAAEQVQADKRRYADALELERGRHQRELLDLREQVGRLATRAEEAERVTQLLGPDPAALEHRLTLLEQERKRLRSELDQRPKVDLTDQVDTLAHRLATAENDRDEARLAAQDLEERLSSQRADLLRLEQVDRANATMEAVISAYEKQVDDLRSQFGQLTEQATRSKPFPACSAMDEDKKLQGRAKVQDVGDLADLVTYLQSAMAFEADEQTGTSSLHYRAEDIRTFLAGLAMSRLHLLEGVSGTGKTTLPRAFAKAIDAGVRMVEVQAGWRDKQDLLGYYNSFERVYRETDCLQYLYRAHQPYFSDKPILIVLDEMNLSHPEHYFADFLSVLENPSASRLSLADKELTDLPRHFASDTGVQLALPRNVWFIGTANQDETTFGFAPKTYDRAHVMNLRPASSGQVGKLGSKPARRSLSFSSLTESFTQAQVDHADEAARAVAFVRGLEGFFDEQFRTRWGHRLERQLRSFVPVHVASGGSLGESLDHMVATKVVTKLEGRRAVRAPQVRELKDRVARDWPDHVRPPKETMALLDVVGTDLEGR